MANPEHVEIVRKGTTAIRDWRQENTDTYLDLRSADLSGANLRSAILNSAILNSADLRSANLRGADLRSADLSGANLSGADLSGANLNSADLRSADLSSADLSGANLRGADLRGAGLRSADLSSADLSGANLRSASLGGTVFADIDLRLVESLETVEHSGPSYISNDTLVRSQGAICDEFLRGCGFQAWEILQTKMHDPTLTPNDIAELQIKIFEKRTHGALFIGGVFISYSRINDRFVDGIYARLKEEGVPVWLDRHDVIAGDLQKQIAKAIRLNDVVLLVLSDAAIKSDWVESELDMAREREKAENRDVLCPISIDDAWKAKLDNDASGRKLWRKLTDKAILDFSPTADFETQFGKLLRGLKINYPK
jgi:TIR domain/Pentapeptide repeats (8 copies)